jgi:fibronectin type 3 domain-containing protein
VHLDWTAPSNGGAAITNYKVYRGTSAGSETLLKTVGSVTSTDDATAVNGTKYYYRVSAVNSAGEGPQSNEVSATPAAAAPPAAFPSTGVIDDFARPAGALGTNWQSPGLADPGTVAIQSSGSTGTAASPSTATWKASTFAADQEAYLAVPTLPKSGSFFQIAGRLSNLTSSSVSCYFLKVTPSTGAWDLRKKLNGAASTSMKTFTTPFAAGDSAGIRIAGSTISAFRKPAGGAWTTVGSTIDTAIPGAGYVAFTLGDTTIRGGALGGGNIAPAAAQRPGAPSLSATAGDGSVHLSWNAPSDGGSAITAYNVYRGTAAGGETLLKGVGNVTSADDATAVNGTTYYYRVSAVNGVGEGSLSNEVSAKPVAAATVPGAPSLSATSGDATVHLAWAAPADGGSPISGYKVYRGTSAGGETLLKSVGNLTATDDATAVNGTTYYYRVSAVNGVGEGVASNEVSATPSGSPPPPPPTFPKTAVLDDFARAAGPLGLNWQSPGLADAGTATIKSSGLTGSSSGPSSATWRTAFTADQEAYLTVPTLPKAGSFFQVAGRVSNLTASSVSCYFVKVTPSTGAWDLRKKLNGAGSTSMKTFSAPFAAGDSAGIQIVGSTISAYRKPALGIWAPVGSTADTAIPGGGYVTFTLGDTTIRGGAFGGGGLS